MDEEVFNGAQLKSFSRLEKLTVGMCECQRVNCVLFLGRLSFEQ